jgi:FkbM family methyltransferase
VVLEKTPQGSEDKDHHEDMEPDLNVNHGALLIRLPGEPATPGKSLRRVFPSVAGFGSVYQQGKRCKLGCVVQVESAGLRWLVDPGDQDHAGPGDAHEPEMTAEILAALPAGGVFVDVGAHVGHYALRAARTAAQVYAVEPVPETATRLRENIALNQLGNVYVVQLAAWNGTARFRIDRIHQQHQRAGSNRVRLDAGGTVWGARLDDALNQYPLRPDRLDVVKIDVEGADIQAIDGMRGLLVKHRPVLFVEDHSPYGYYPRADLLEIIDSAGYGPRLRSCDCGDYWRCDPL